MSIPNNIDFTKLPPELLAQILQAALAQQEQPAIPVIPIGEPIVPPVPIGLPNGVLIEGDQVNLLPEVDQASDLAFANRDDSSASSKQQEEANSNPTFNSSGSSSNNNIPAGPLLVLPLPPIVIVGPLLRKVQDPIDLSGLNPLPEHNLIGQPPKSNSEPLQLPTSRGRVPKAGNTSGVVESETKEEIPSGLPASATSQDGSGSGNSSYEYPSEEESQSGSSGEEDKPAEKKRITKRKQPEEEEEKIDFEDGATKVPKINSGSAAAGTTRKGIPGTLIIQDFGPTEDTTRQGSSTRQWIVSEKSSSSLIVCLSS